MKFQRAVGKRVWAVMRFNFPTITAEADLNGRLDDVVRASYLTQQASDDEICAAVVNFAWSEQRLAELRPCIESSQEARNEFAALLKFRGDTLASGTLFKQVSGQTVSIDDAVYLARKIKHRAVYEAWGDPYEPGIPSQAEFDQFERAVRQRCGLPDDLPAERFAQAVDDYNTLCGVHREVIHAEEHSAGTIGKHRAAQRKVLKLVRADKRAFDLLVRLHLGEHLSAEDYAYAHAEVKRTLTQCPE